jgi:hypothetical protein
MGHYISNFAIVIFEKRWRSKPVDNLDVGDHLSIGILVEAQVGCVHNEGLIIDDVILKNFRGAGESCSGRSCSKRRCSGSICN